MNSLTITSSGNYLSNSLVKKRFSYYKVIYKVSKSKRTLMTKYTELGSLFTDTVEAAYYDHFGTRAF
jgi:hypothetical protein